MAPQIRSPRHSEAVLCHAVIQGKHADPWLSHATMDILLAPDFHLGKLWAGCLLFDQKMWFGLFFWGKYVNNAKVSRCEAPEGKTWSRAQSGVDQTPLVGAGCGGGGMDSPTVQVYDSGPPPPALGCFCSEPACLASGLILFSISIKISLWLARLQPGHNTAGCWWTAISKHIKTERRFSASPYGLGSPSRRAIINAFHSYKTPAGHPNGSVGQCQCNTFKQKRTSPPKEPPTGTPPPVGFACRVRTLGRRNRLSSQQP